MGSPHQEERRESQRLQSQSPGMRKRLPCPDLPSAPAAPRVENPNPTTCKAKVSCPCLVLSLRVVCLLEPFRNASALPTRVSKTFDIKFRPQPDDSTTCPIPIYRAHRLEVQTFRKKAAAPMWLAHGESARCHRSSLVIAPDASSSMVCKQGEPRIPPNSSLCRRHSRSPCLSFRRPFA
eukprot:5711028-Amphidinium_carterae.1